MNTSKDQALRVCGHCQKGLPLEAFYTNTKTQKPDAYCKECRKAVNGKRRALKKRAERVGKTAETINENPRKHYPLITQTEDLETRRALITHAQWVVAESMKRKAEKRWAEAD